VRGYKAGIARYSTLKNAVAAGKLVRGVARYKARYKIYADYDDSESYSSVCT